ncbi:SIR2 family protein [Pelagibacterium sp. H642]|uniref:SIR2 family NAD-dependent protein deacylase n=1 Tax=Pelagibacterium sp. H642 TaxID=1881069 RepID=UPI002814ADE1|nr:SIR2 family protein [Pelagibacterium sp. H642]WMT92639.1 SIR2 family protein [Pelagibacterium sp. H642]
MSNDMEVLADAVRKRKAILFVGAGVSISVGLPSWDFLIEHMIESLDLSPEEVEDNSISHQTLAEYYMVRMGGIGPLRSWMDREWKVSEESVQASRVHQLIVELDFPRIYTTNYDRNLEIAYKCQNKPYHRIANARDFAAAPDEVTQIVKFHGDFDDDDSMVLAEADYFRRLAFDSPLDTKFHADALGHTLLFIGYSMTDINIRLLLHRVWQAWIESGQERDRPRSFVFMPRPNRIQETVLNRWGITLLTGSHGDPEEALVDFLSQVLEVRNTAD